MSKGCGKYAMTIEENKTHKILDFLSHDMYREPVVTTTGLAWITTHNNLISSIILASKVLSQPLEKNCEIFKSH